MTTTTLPTGTGVVSSYTHDPSARRIDRLTAVSHVKGGTTLASATYTLDSVGNRTQRVDQQGTHTYAYDNVYRLTSVTYPGPATTTYAYDAFGNRTSKVDGRGTTTYAYDPSPGRTDRITSVTKPGPTTVTYTWDNPSRGRSNLTNRGSDSFAWDVEDRMTSATVGGTTTTFAYRGDGLRASRTTGGVTTSFTWDVNAGLPVVLDDGNQYVYGAGLVSEKQSGSWYYYLADGLGSTMAIVNASGVVQNSYTYDVYGKPTKTGSLANDFDFAGQQTDATGLQYLRARYMDPETGTFVSRDPLAAMPGWRHPGHGYVRGNPVNATDPAGLCDDGSPACQGAPPPAGQLTCPAGGCRIDLSDFGRPSDPLDPRGWWSEEYIEVDSRGRNVHNARWCAAAGDYLSGSRQCTGPLFGDGVPIGEYETCGVVAVRGVRALICQDSKTDQFDPRPRWVQPNPGLAEWLLGEIRQCLIGVAAGAVIGGKSGGGWGALGGAIAGCVAETTLDEITP